MAKASNQGPEVKALRKFGINETYQMAMYIIDQYRNTILSCRYAIPPQLAPADSRTQLEAEVKIAVADTIMRHPMMHVGIIDATSKTPSWIQLKTLDLSQHIKWLYLEEHADFEQTIQELNCAQLDDRCWDLSSTQPHWKMTIIRQANAPTMEILLTWNHSQFDGIGAKVFHEDFLHMLNANINTINTHERPDLRGDIFTLPLTPPILPTPIEKLSSLPLDLKYLGKTFWEEIRPQFLNNRDITQAMWCPIRTAPYKTQFRVFDIDKAALANILTLCRKNKTTFTGLLNGLLLLAFSAHLTSTTAPAFQSSTVMDHRPNLPPAAQPDAPWGQTSRAVANYVTQVLHRYEPDLVARVRSTLPDNDGEAIDLSADMQRELWAAAAQNRLDILRKMDDPLRNDVVGLFKYVTDWKQTMSNMAKRPRMYFPPHPKAAKTILLIFLSMR